VVLACIAASSWWAGNVRHLNPEEGSLFLEPLQGQWLMLQLPGKLTWKPPKLTMTSQSSPQRRLQTWSRQTNTLL